MDKASPACCYNASYTGWQVGVLTSAAAPSAVQALHRPACALAGDGDVVGGRTVQPAHRVQDGSTPCGRHARQGGRTACLLSE